MKLIDPKDIVTGKSYVLDNRGGIVKGYFDFVELVVDTVVNVPHRVRENWYYGYYKELGSPHVFEYFSENYDSLNGYVYEHESESESEDVVRDYFWDLDKGKSKGREVNIFQLMTNQEYLVDNSNGILPTDKKWVKFHIEGFIIAESVAYGYMVGIREDERFSVSLRELSGNVYEILETDTDTDTEDKAEDESGVEVEVEQFTPKIVASSRVEGLEGIEVDRDVWVVVCNGQADIVREGYVRDSGWAGVLRLESVLWAGGSLFFKGGRDGIIGQVTFEDSEVGVKLVEALKTLEKGMEVTF